MTTGHAATALRYLCAADAAARLQRQATAAVRHAEQGGVGRPVDVPRVRLLLDEVRVALNQTSQIKRRATDIRKSADAITAEAQGMERRIGDSLAQAEYELGLSEQFQATSAAATSEHCEE